MIKYAMSSLFSRVQLTTAMGFVVVLGLCQAGVFTTPVQAQQVPASSPRGGPKEAIKIHGYWTIDVRNPDGTLVKHIEFENALTPHGASELARILARVSTPGLWEIRLTNTNSSADPWAQPGVTGGVILEPSPSAVATARQAITLTVSSPQAGPNAGQLVLSGNITADHAGAIDKVQTESMSCASTILPNLCQNNQANDAGIFTEKTLDQPVNGACPANAVCAVNVVAGQIIQVTVVISFS